MDSTEVKLRDLVEALRPRVPDSKQHLIEPWLRRAQQLVAQSAGGSGGARGACCQGVVEQLLRVVPAPLVDHRLVTVADVVEAGLSVQAGRLCDSGQGEGAGSGLLLCARLTAWRPRDVTGWPGCLMLRDVIEHSPLVCQIASSCDLDLLSHLDRWLVFVTWSYHPDHSPPVVEIEGAVVPIDATPPVSPCPLRVLDACDAATLLRNKAILPPACLVSFRGTVLAVSEVISVKKHNFFMVKMEENIHIIIKEAAVLHWQQCLVPLQDFVFTDLRPTRLAKTGAHGCRSVYIPTASSKLLSPALAAQHLELISLQEWLSAHGVDAATASNLVKPLSQPQEESATQEPLVSYKGIITSVAKAPFGMVELDSKVWLCVCALPAVLKLASLREGAVIFVYNVVRKGFKKDCKIWLVAGVQTCIRVHKFAPLNSLPCVFDASLPVFRLFHSHALSSMDTVKLACVVQQLATVVGRCNGADNWALQDLMCPLCPRTCSWLADRKRNLVTEFIWHSPLDDRVPTVLPLCDLSGGGRKEDQSWSWSQTVSWHGSEQTGQLLLGRLEFSPETGQVMLCDGLGKTDLVTCDRTRASPHTCCQTCLVVPPVGQRVTCPYIHPGLQGALVAVTDFALVREPDGNYPCAQHYLMVSLQDCILLAPPRGCCPLGGPPPPPLAPPASAWCLCCGGVDSNRDPPSVEEGRAPTRTSRRGSERSVGRKELSSERDGKVHSKLNPPPVDEGTPPTRICGRGSKQDCGARREGRSSDRDGKGGCVCCPPSDSAATCSSTGTMFGASGEADNVHPDLMTSTKKKRNVQGRLGRNPKNNSNFCQSTAAGKAVFENSQPSGEICDACGSGWCCSGRNAGAVNGPSGESPASGGQDAESARVPVVNAEAAGTKAGQSRMVVVTHKECLLHLPQVCHGHRYFSALGVILPARLAPGSVGGESGRVHQGGAVECPGRAPSGSSGQAGMAPMAATEGKVGRAVEGAETPVPVVLVFEGRAVRWHAVLTTPGLYQLWVAPGQGSLTFQSLPSRLESAVALSGVPLALRVPEACLLQRHWPGSLPELDRVNHHDYLSVEAVLSDSVADQLVDVVGTVLERRNFTEAFQHGTLKNSASGASPCVRLRLGGVGGMGGAGGSRELLVYMQLGQATMPLGVVPGAQLALQRLQRCVSKMGTVYCRFNLASSLCVLAVPPRLDPLDGTSLHTDSLDVAHSDRCEGAVEESTRGVLLSEMWGGCVGEGRCRVRCLCHVYLVVRLSLQSRCLHCASLSRQDCCSNPLCLRTGASLSTRLSMLVEDGSGQAVVVVTQPDYVRQVLGLTGAEWSAVECCVHSAGDVLISQYCQEAESDLESFLHALCDSALLKRSWMLTLRCEASHAHMSSHAHTPSHAQSSSHAHSSSHAQNSSIHRLALAEFALRRVRVGERSLETRSLPFLQFRCLRLEPPDYVAMATATLRRQTAGPEASAS